MIQPGDKVRKIANPGRVGILGNETSGAATRLRYLVSFLDGTEDFVLLDSLEKVDVKPQGAYELMLAGRYGRVSDLRGTITFYRLSGKLANLIYSLNTTNTQFFPYQFKPVLQFLDSPSNGILIADEVGLGKTIEAGLIWTEMRARQDARRLLIVCPAMLCEKWKAELSNRFGVKAQIVDAADLLAHLEEACQRSQTSFALIVSMQGVRPPSGWDADDAPSQSASAKLARFLNESEMDEPLLDMVVIDEAHYLRNDSTQTYRFGALLRPVTLSLVMLSATPIQLKSADLFNLLHLLDEDAFPYEGSFDFVLRMNEPVVQLRDRILAGLVVHDEFVDAMIQLQASSFYSKSLQVQYFLENPPTADVLTSARGRSELADQLDKLNPLTKVVTRTLKREVHENRVQREPHVIRAVMSQVESAFYEAVTTKVRDYCAEMDVSEGFMLTIPQRQMSSSMAAACEGWQRRLSDMQAEDDETLYALDVEIESQSSRPKGISKKNIGELLRELITIAQSVGNAKALRAGDSKYNALLNSLRGYRKSYFGKKVVLFSFYKNTLHYLSERLAQDGLTSIVLHGGMDKQAALKNFEDVSGPDILLSSEVAAEGVDLQFSSVLINYDLPWNPAKIEQRIGRIDRIGQEEPKILIWNFVYQDTVDDRVCTRLLERLNTFERALGSMEAVLGDEIRALSHDLLTHKLTPDQEKSRIDRACVAIETVNRQQEQLESEATNLIAHGDFIQNKVKAANELGRFIHGNDLFAYVHDFVTTSYPGTRLLADPKQLDFYQLDLSIEGRMDLTDFLQTYHLQGQTALLSATPPNLVFENKLGKAKNGLERVTQDHPLIRFVTQRMLVSGRANTYTPVTACQVFMSNPRVAPGDYVYVVSRWSFSGSRDVERLEYAVKRISDGVLLDGDLAESLVNAAALHGKDWLGASNSVDPKAVADMQDQCRAELEENFRTYRDSYAREDADRIQQMIRLLEVHLTKKLTKLSERIDRTMASADAKKQRIVPALKGQITKEELRVEQRMAELRLKATLDANDILVTSGLIRVN